VGMWVVGGAYLAVVLQTTLGVDAVITLPIAFFLFAGIGWLVGPFIYRVRTSNYALPALMALAFTFGISTVIRGGLLASFGYTPVAIHSPLFDGVWHIAGISIAQVRVAGFDFALIL